MELWLRTLECNVFWNSSGRVVKTMKKIFAKLHSWMELSKVGKLIYKCVTMLKIDTALYVIADTFNPCFSREMVEEAREYFDKNADLLKSTLAKLEDDESKKTLDAVVKFRISGKRRYLWKVKRPDAEQYFMSEKERNILPLKNEYFVDCGACVGDTFQNYIKHGTYKKYYAFEPNPYNFAAWEKFPDQNIILYPYGTGEEEGEYGFDFRGGGIVRK